ncbi:MULTISPECIES: GntR family transcriptional regulator [unclassified Meiothermus]|uniref:GntR family transcriptional regulator n=1 Tax=unclassified Meiothermus TaxID=370471 RepID=UPI000D7D107E|nr:MULTISPECIES: GntR family transcriptional regulator [unclassified Meiothermus]PZA05994.1 GntR family transcriptional regulator [Meiothermus sp. Pnk-1]RYM35257.1 GntR family transcriptional regulator [Meiothermus sp. PNK-Is4]
MSPSQTGEAYRQLRRRILSLELRPGEALGERRLAGLLRVSRTPVRAALERLAREGLVRRFGRGYVVAPLDLAELAEAFAFRSVLEAAAVRWAAARHAEVLEAAGLLDRLEEAPDPERELELATEFHLALARLAGNRFLVEALAGVLPGIYRARFVEAFSPEGRAQAHREHRRILELVREGRGEEAAALVQAHLERAYVRLLESLERSYRGLLAAGAEVRR